MAFQSEEILEISAFRYSESLELQSKLDGILIPYFEKRGRQIRQPIEDFLFEYYSFGPNKLRSWNPGFGVQPPSDWKPTDSKYTLNEAGTAWTLQSSGFPGKRLPTLKWVIELQEAMLQRPPAFGCHGLHEWAMVYKIDAVRHEQLPLRLRPDVIAKTVDSLPIRCSHYDAFRFFTQDAEPLNNLSPTYDARLEFEQGGCIHANMDLYKWAYKFYPWMGSELIWEAFLLAREIRYFDMQASPYDLSAYGLEPICIETVEGRREYTQKQQGFAEKARQVRIKLVSELKKMESWVTQDSI
jgi:hypothetical protein